MPMGIFTMVSGSTTELMGSVLISRHKDHNILDSGSMISSKEKEKKNGLMARNLREVIRTVKRMEKASSCGEMTLNLKETLLIMSYKEKEFINGLTIGCLMVIG